MVKSSRWQFRRFKKSTNDKSARESAECAQGVGCLHPYAVFATTRKPLLYLILSYFFQGFLTVAT